ncbi:hypothetical protein SDRG_15420 [Saprolegnia diclina VS20]|uniref:Uncharacterized protein n=1 Tax=Saprolegnia diclina (strain VS20) TaxID=1156394 RepID=T0Q074_SAPDV|nr:hypothetical protein SDRG_15420 [Saprolegnia diclina VS20]EQC26770.1 hypothetical protein SDRG_15420 [Saprolegnia diclina VS20]|eukprot:XP_008619813.1 hypothetical protein SDRG_15420 [Saprolegnia diclina VS20]
MRFSTASCVDHQAECTSGELHIGSAYRMAVLIGAVLASHGVCYLVVQRTSRKPPSTHVASLFLTSGAKFLFVSTPWMYKNVYYVDRASAALVGFLTLRLSTTLVVLDVKIWRHFQLPLTNDAAVPTALRCGVPLRDTC